MKYIPIAIAVSTAFVAVSCQKEIKSSSNQRSAASVDNSQLEVADTGAVFTMTNAASGNKIAYYKRAADGSLTLKEMVPTGGKGTGTALGSQGAIALSEDKNWLFAVNAGSNQISVAHITPDGLELTDTALSPGQVPISLAVHGDMVYVLHSMENFTGFIVGFRFNNGRLHVIPQSGKNLSKDSVIRPAQIAFNSDGKSLIITEKANRKIATFTLNANGVPVNRQLKTSAGIEPFGFAVGQSGNIYVTEAYGGRPNESTVSSYKVDGTGNVTAVDKKEHTHQTAACWAVITEDFKFLYVTNAGSSSVSGYKVNGGNITLLNSDGITATTGAAPIDEALSTHSKYLYVLNQVGKSISAYAVNTDGSLTKIGDVTGLHQKSVGLAAK